MGWKVKEKKINTLFVFKNSTCYNIRVSFVKYLTFNVILWVLNNINLYYLSTLRILIQFLWNCVFMNNFQLVLWIDNANQIPQICLWKSGKTFIKIAQFQLLFKHTSEMNKYLMLKIMLEINQHFEFIFKIE